VLRELGRIACALPDSIEIWFGGNAPAHLITGRLRRRVFALPTLHEFYEQVRVR